MSLSRRWFLQLLSGSLCAVSSARAEGRIGRRALVRRHNPVLRALDPRAPLTVGNGEFAFTADVTGLQSLSESYARDIPLCTQSQWGWHSFPIPKGLAAEDLRLTYYDTYGRKVGYPTGSDGQQELFNWLRENPHRLHLGRIGLLLDDAPLKPGGLAAIRQTLDLWSGVLQSSFQIAGSPAFVETCCHPQLDAIAVKIRSPLLADRRLTVVLDFPYGSPQMGAADWDHPELHRSQPHKQAPNRCEIRRELDGDRYGVTLGWEGQALIERRSPHRFLLRAGRERNRDHPSMLAALGVLPGSRVDPETMRRTLKRVLSVWRWQDTWGWDYPLVAMTAARLGEPALALDALMMDTPKNQWLPNGHNWQRPNLPLYLPANGGLLAAIAMMAAGWQGGPNTRTPGFARDSWAVGWEGLYAFL